MVSEWVVLWAPEHVRDRQLSLLLPPGDQGLVLGRSEPHTLEPQFRNGACGGGGAVRDVPVMCVHTCGSAFPLLWDLVSPIYQVKPGAMMKCAPIVL